MRFRGEMTPRIGHLLQVRKELLGLHKLLLDLERSGYEARHGRVQSINVLFNLVNEDPWFAWLHHLSRFIVEIDEAFAWDEPMTDADAARFLERTRDLLSAPDEGGEFQTRYHAMMQREPDVIVLHGAVMRVLSSTP